MSKPQTSRYGATNDYQVGSPTASGNPNVIEMVMDIRERLARLEQKVDDMDREIHELRKELRKRNGYIKILLAMLGTALSVIASLVGIKCVP